MYLSRISSLKSLTSTKLKNNFLFSIRSIATKSQENVVTIDVHAAKNLLGSGHRYLDVRTTEELEKSPVIVDNAFNVPYMFFNREGRVKNPEFLAQVASVCKKDDCIVVGCRSGVRSLSACVDLLNAGFEHVKNMGGGYSAWVDNGLSGDKPAEKLN